MRGVVTNFGDPTRPGFASVSGFDHAIGELDEPLGARRMTGGVACNFFCPAAGYKKIKMQSSRASYMRVSFQRLKAPPLGRRGGFSGGILK